MGAYYRRAAKALDAQQCSHGIACRAVLRRVWRRFTETVPVRSICDAVEEGHERRVTAARFGPTFDEGRYDDSGRARIRLVLLADAPLSFREFMTHEQVPLASLFHATFEVMQKDPGIVLFGAHAVNAYCEPARMTQDVDVLSTRARELASELKTILASRFHITIRVREVIPNIGFRVYQVCNPKHRHLVDVRHVEKLPAFEMREGIAVVTPVELIAMKVESLAYRSNQEKGLSDRLDLARLLRTFPELRDASGPVTQRLEAGGGNAETTHFWNEVRETIFDVDPDGDDDEV